MVLCATFLGHTLAPTTTKAQYDLKDAKAFAQFLHDADVRLVRARCKSLQVLLLLRLLRLRRLRSSC